jgi:hypothetical protein
LCDRKARHFYRAFLIYDEKVHHFYQAFPALLINSGVFLDLRLGGVAVHYQPMKSTEAGLVILAPQEQHAFVRAAQHLRETCEMVIDLAQPISEHDLIFLQVAQAVVTGDTQLLDVLNVKIEQRIRALYQPN